MGKVVDEFHHGHVLCSFRQVSSNRWWPFGTHSQFNRRGCRSRTRSEVDGTLLPWYVWTPTALLLPRMASKQACCRNHATGWHGVCKPRTQRESCHHIEV